MEYIVREQNALADGYCKTKEVKNTRRYPGRPTTFDPTRALSTTPLTKWNRTNYSLEYYYIYLIHSLFRWARCCHRLLFGYIYSINNWQFGEDTPITVEVTHSFAC